MTPSFPTRRSSDLYSVDDLEAAHKAITNDIAKTIRWGYVEATDDAEEKVGEPENLIVSVEHHSNFVHALFEKRQAGLRDQEGRSISSRSEEHTSELQSLMRISYAVFCLKQH